MNMQKMISSAFAAMLALIFCLSAFGQGAFRVGEEVEYKCSRSTGWCGGKIEAIDGNMIRVRWGNMRNQADTVKNTQEFIRAIPKPDSPQTVAFQEGFRSEALNKYIRSIQMIAPFHDDQYNSSGAPTTIAGWNEVMTHLTELDGLCKGKFAGVTNTGTAWLLRQGQVDYRYAVWCEIAANRDALGMLARRDAAKRMISLRVTDHLKYSFESPKNVVHDETQMLMYDRAKWRQQTTIAYKGAFADYGIDMPADFFAVVEKRADELKQIIEKTAPTRSWEQPAYKDAAAEAYIRRRYAADYPGAKILGSGTNYKDWDKKTSVSLAGSGTGYKLYTLEHTSYKHGWILAKHPNQPFCLASEFSVGRGAKGMGGYFGKSGFYVKCP